MLSLRRSAVALSSVLALMVTLTGCTSSSPSKPKVTTSPAGSTGSTAPATGGRPVNRATVAAALQKGLATATSAHLVASTTLAGQTLAGAGDVALSEGAITQANLQQGLPSGLGTIAVVVAGGKTYAKLPSALRTDAAKPWVLLSAASSSTIVSELASVLQPILAVASPASLVAFTRSAASVTDLGAGSGATTHYRVVVDASSLPTSIPSSITGGRAQIPIEMYLDATGRPRRVTGTFSISGQTVTPTIELSNYNAPVSITAPPAGQVSAR